MLIVHYVCRVILFIYVYMFRRRTKSNNNKTSVLPQLTYCHTVWHFCKTSDRRKLERVQECALRAIFNMQAHAYEELLNRANLSTLYNRRLQDSNSNVQGEKQYKSTLC
jgi:hypothetical protein